MKRLKVGVIGCGVMGGFHLKQYLSLADVELIGASDLDPNRKPEGITFFPDAKDLIKLVDAVSIVTPTFTHFDTAMQALDAGKHVLIEKPIALDEAQAKKLIDKAKKKKLIIAVGHIERFNPAYNALKMAFYKRRPDVIDIKRFSPFPARISDVSCVIDMMIHDIDLACDLAGANVRSINAIGKKVKTQMVDQALAVIVFENGTVANIETSRVHADKVRQLIITSKDMLFEADLLNRKLVISSKGKKEEVTVEQYDQLQTELKDFVKAVLLKKQPLVSGMDGAKAISIANKIEEIASA